MEKKYGAAECGDCNTCGKCDALYEESVPELKGFDDAVAAAAAIDRNSYEKNLARLRKATFEQDNAQGQQVETFSRNAVVRPTVPGHEGALLSSHHGLQSGDILRQGGQICSEARVVKAFIKKDALLIFERNVVALGRKGFIVSRGVRVELCA